MKAMGIGERMPIVHEESLTINVLRFYEASELKPIVRITIVFGCHR